MNAFVASGLVKRADPDELKHCLCKTAFLYVCVPKT
jgi:hypothetical protein